MSQNVCEVILEVFHKAGVRYVFAIAGGALNTMLEALRTQDKIKLIQVRHEESGAFAASAIGKLGGLAVCMGTSGGCYRGPAYFPGQAGVGLVR